MAGIPSIPKINRLLTSVSAFGQADPAAAYIAAITSFGATASAPQQAAVSTFMAGEIAAGRWEGIKRLYLPIWGVAAANAVCMKSLTSCTFNGGFTHAAGYIQGGSNKYITLGTTLAGLGISVDSHYFAALCKTALQDNYRSLLVASFTFGYGEEGIRVDDSGTNTVNDNSFSPSDLFGIGSYGSQTTFASRYCRLRKASGVATVSVKGGTLSGSYNSPQINMLGAFGSGYWTGQVGGLVLATYMSAADDLLFTAALETLWETTTGLTLP